MNDLETLFLVIVLVSLSVYCTMLHWQLHRVQRTADFAAWYCRHLEAVLYEHITTPVRIALPVDPDDWWRYGGAPPGEEVG